MTAFDVTKQLDALLPAAGAEADAEPLDSGLLRDAQSGGRAARAELLRRVQDPVFRYCVAMLGDAEAAVDATQETALRMLAQLDRFRGDSRVTTWAIGIALNVCREQIRKRGRITADHRRRGVSVPVQPDALAAQRELHARLRDRLGELSGRQREAIVLRYFEGLSVRETAALMRVATGTVKATTRQAIDRLRQLMEHDR